MYKLYLYLNYYYTFTRKQNTYYVYNYICFLLKLREYDLIYKSVEDKTKYWFIINGIQHSARFSKLVSQTTPYIVSLILTIVIL